MHSIPTVTASVLVIHYSLCRVMEIVYCAFTPEESLERTDTVSPTFTDKCSSELAVKSTVT